MNILGLDLSLTSTGWSCDEATGNLVSKETGTGRLFDLRLQLIDVLLEFKPDLIAIENYSFGSRNSRAHAIGEWGGVVRVLLWDKGFPYIEIPPTCRAKFATGKGNASKGEVMSAISARTGIIWSGKGAEDRCDAWILEEMALANRDEARFAWPAINMSALEKIDWSPSSRFTKKGK